MSTTTSPTQTRKQREIAEREAKVLAVSRRLVIEHGYHGWTMDHVARELEYSKGTIYNHFPCKEEILIALAIETMDTRSAMFNRASAFRGRARERMLAVGRAAELFLRLYPDHLCVEQIIRTPSIMEKTSEERRNAMRGCENRCMAITAGIVRDAIAQGDLVLTENMVPEDVVFGLWSMTSGAHQLIPSSDSLRDIGIRDAFLALRQNQHRLLDGFGWRPLTVDLAEEEVSKRIQEEVFSDEYQQLGIDA